MLVLSRQRDESIMIGDDIELVVVDIRGDKVRLGFIAPGDVEVHRREIFDAIQLEKQQASNGKSAAPPQQAPQQVPPQRTSRPPSRGKGGMRRGW